MSKQADNENINRGENAARTIMRPVFDPNRDGDVAGWGPSVAFDTMAIERLKSTVDAEQLEKLEYTPTPFNRMELARIAFEFVSALAADTDPIVLLEGNTAYHKLVSECFDVGELFFFTEKHEKELQIIEWNKLRDLDALLTASNKQKYLGYALNMFMGRKHEDDVHGISPASLEKIYLLNYPRIGGANGMKILGGTSPYTLFFAADGNKSRANFIHGEHQTFSERPVPLYRRDPLYIKFWFALKHCWQTITNQDRGFGDCFPALDAYLKITFDAIESTNQRLAHALQGEAMETLLDYWTRLLRPISVGRDDDAQTLELLPGFFLKQFPAMDVAAASSFTIQPTRVMGTTPLPLVLPVEKKMQYVQMTYTTTKFNKEIPVPYTDPLPLAERRLPSESIKYPYLTEGDFFYDTIILNEGAPDEHYFYGRQNSQKYSVLLPIKPIYFNYFTVEDLQRGLTVHIEKEAAEASRIIVTLRIPVKEGSVVYSRVYCGVGDEENHEGKVILQRFMLGVYPFVYIPTSLKIQADYRVLLSRVVDTEHDLPLDADFYAYTPAENENDSGECERQEARLIERNRNNDGTPCVRNFPVAKSYIVAKSFDYLEVIINNDVRGILVPLWTTLNPSQRQQYTFAVDFGTSNTHIDGYQNEARNVFLGKKVLEKTEFQLSSKVDLTTIRDFRKILMSDYFPEALGNNYSFPVRTILNAAQNVAWNELNEPLAQANIPYCYGEYKLCDYDEPLTNLKWGMNNEGIEQMKSFLAALLFQLRNRLLYENAILENTQIIRFYPKSMPYGHAQEMSRVWENLYKRYFGGDPLRNVNTLMESLAPFYYYCRRENANGRFLCIDIGGETTDVVFAREQGKPVFVTSFRFASGALYGDGYNRWITNNGFVQYFTPRVREAIQRINTSTHRGVSPDLVAVLEQIYARGNSMDMLNYFFSLHKKTDGVVDFASMLLENLQFRAVYVVYFGAIVYHLAQMLKSEKMTREEALEYMPQAIAFTGNGSRAFDILDRSRERKALQLFAQSIFEYVLEEKVKNDARIILEENPKEKLCEGGLLEHADIDGDKITLILLGDREMTRITETSHLHFSDVTDEQIASILGNVDDFYAMLLSAMDGRFSYDRYFDIDCRRALFEQLEIERKSPLLLQDLRTAIRTRGGEAGEIEISETFFFFPIIGSLSVIAERLAK